MFRSVVRLAGKKYEFPKPAVAKPYEKSDEYGFPPRKDDGTVEPYTELKKTEPLENYKCWDTQRYVNKGVEFYDLIDNMHRARNRLDRDDANKKPFNH